MLNKKEETSKKRTRKVSINDTSLATLSPGADESITYRSFRDKEKPLLRLVMGHPQLHDMMLNFARKELSTENLLLYDSIHVYNECDDYERKKEMAINIYETFLEAGQVNIPEAAKMKVFDQMEMGLFDNCLFMDIEAEVELCLNDTLQRFSTTKEYREYMDEFLDLGLNKDKPTAEVLLTIINDTELRDMFLRISHISETILNLWDMIQQYKMDDNIEAKQEKAEKIATEFATCIDDNIFQCIEEQIAMGLFDNLLFAELEKEIQDEVFYHADFFKCSEEYTKFWRNRHRSRLQTVS